MRQLVDAAASLLLGAACPCCGAPGAGTCPGCAAGLAAPGVVPVAGPGPPVRAAAPYEAPWAPAIVALKERSAWYLADALGAALAVAVAAVLAEGGHPEGELWLVPVPSRPAAVRGRGQDTTRLLARRAADALRAVGLRCRPAPLLRHTRRVRDQAGLDVAGRAANLAGAFGTAPLRGAGASCVVVDDLTTTGATLREGVRALAQAGHRPLGCAVVAAAARRFPVARRGQAGT